MIMRMVFGVLLFLSSFAMAEALPQRLWISVRVAGTVQDEGLSLGARPDGLEGSSRRRRRRARGVQRVQTIEGATAQILTSAQSLQVSARVQGGEATVQVQSGGVQSTVRVPLGQWIELASVSDGGERSDSHVGTGGLGFQRSNGGGGQRYLLRVDKIP